MSDFFTLILYFVPSILSVRFLSFRLKDSTDDHGIGLNDLASCSGVKMESFRLDRSESALLVIAINTMEMKTLIRNTEFVKYQGAIGNGNSKAATAAQITTIVV